jgi:hypothetical protein
LNLYFQELGINILESQIIQIIARNQPERATFLELIDTLQEQFIHSKVATLDDIHHIKHSLEKMIHSDHIFYCPQFSQILG